jgi:4-hydroxy-4-methyl-2-oxoglutarate aldolase
MVHVYTTFDRPERDVVDEYRRLDAATVHEAAGRIGAVRSCIKPLERSMKVIGPALTVRCHPKDNLMLHKAIQIARPGDVIVAETDSFTEAGYWGGLMATSAMARGIAGLVIDGGVRDSGEIIEMGFPVFCRTTCVRGTSKQHLGLVNHPITLGEVVINPGDLVVADGDGVVVVPRERIGEVLQAGKKRVNNEIEKRAKLASGVPGVELNKLEPVFEALGMVEE